LFYLAGNPPTGVLINGGRPINGTLINEDGAVVDRGTASASWWVSSHIYGRLEIQSPVLSDTSCFLVFLYFPVQSYYLSGSVS
jgi:hypothetical protein